MRSSSTTAILELLFVVLSKNDGVLCKFKLYDRKNIWLGPQSSGDPWGGFISRHDKYVLFDDGKGVVWILPRLLRRRSGGVRHGGNPMT